MFANVNAITAAEKRSLEALRLQPRGKPPQCFLLPLHPGIKLGYLVNGC